MSLFHYTCDHAYPTIMLDREIRPNPHVEPSLVWLTDLAMPIRDALGLTSTYISCDRTAHRIEITEPPQTIFPWYLWRRAHPQHRHIAYVWENAEGARPAHWYVSEQAIPI
jgi:hypothetical protein